MEGISDIKIIGIDETRPPKIRKEPYIDIIFKLSHQAPAEWCRAFNALLAKHTATPKIKESEGIYIEAYVRTIDEIAPFLALLQAKIAECSQQYIECIESAARSAGNINSALALEAGEQGRLNRAVAALDFGEIKV